MPRTFVVAVSGKDWDQVNEAFGACEGGESYTEAMHDAEVRIAEQLTEQGYEIGAEYPDEGETDVLVARITSKMEPQEVYNELRRLFDTAELGDIYNRLNEWMAGY